MPVQAIALAAGEPPRRRKKRFCFGHPLFEVARTHCDRHGRKRNVPPCDGCWEQAIRDDERFVVEHGLPRELTVDPSHVDEIAVEKACKGERVTLTPVERAAARRRLSAKGLSHTAIAKLLHMATRDLSHSDLADRGRAAVPTSRPRPGKSVLRSIRCADPAGVR